MSKVTVKLFVQKSSTCVELLRYVNRRIADIHSRNIRIKIDKITPGDIDEELTEMFRRAGITRLPALLLPDGKPLIGVESITSLFERNIKSAVNNRRVKPTANEDIQSYWDSELYTTKEGRRVPRTDPDEGPNVSGDMMKQRVHSAATERKTPRGRPRGIGGNDSPPQTGYVREPPGEQALADEYGDDESEGYPEDNVISSIARTNLDDERDALMMQAWAENNN